METQFKKIIALGALASTLLTFNMQAQTARTNRSHFLPNPPGGLMPSTK